MAISGPDNPWWWDVLENGPASQYSRYFDVDWHSDSDHQSNLIILPVLGDHYGIVLENSELILMHESGRFTLNYFDHVFPVAPRSVSQILQMAYEKKGIGQLGFLSEALESLAHASSRDVGTIDKRQRDKQVLYNLLRDLVIGDIVVKEAIDEAVVEINNDYELLDELMGKQNYKLTFWKLSKFQVGYRRFFNINTLVGLRMEDEHAFDDSHRLVFELAEKGLVNGFRIDHPDGLYDPTSYFARLRNKCPDALIVAEKILEQHEELPSNWNISGTTGYDFLNLANGLFVDPEGFERLRLFWHEISECKKDYSTLVYQNKKKIIKELLGSEFNRLANDLAAICENHRRFRDFASSQLLEAIEEIAAHLQIYRTYIQPETVTMGPLEREEIERAVSSAIEKSSELEEYIFEFIRKILLLELKGTAESDFVRRFQQVTGPVMAKSLEDTVFYLYHPLSSVNEVGGNPGSPVVDTKKFHDHCHRIARYWPLTMLASSTHDSKRSEDVRARLNVLSEIPLKWITKVRKWFKANRQYKNGPLPDANTEYLLYQTLVGSWPIDIDRIKGYMLKAVREAKEHTSWFDPNEKFENSLEKFIESLYQDDKFIESLEAFVTTIRWPGWLNSLAQLVLKLTAPGFPDVYQGNELWNNSLTDPDNRRPVDYVHNARMLNKIDGMNCSDIFAEMEKGLPKIFVIKKLLELRKHYPAFNEPDSYSALEVNGSEAENIVAFRRGNNILVVVPRLSTKSRNKILDARVLFPEGEWENVFTKQIYKSGFRKMKELFKVFPVAVLVRVSGKDD
jgi:(1->4)-alpha-D-glucan 1-alpha-D-glucosylmutase